MKKILTILCVSILMIIVNTASVDAAKSTTYKYNSKWTFQYNALPKKTVRTNTQYIYLSKSVYKDRNIKRYINNAVARIELVDNDGRKSQRAGNFNVKYTNDPNQATIVVYVDNTTLKTNGKSVVLGKAVPCSKRYNGKLSCDDDGSKKLLASKNKVDVYNLVIYKKSFDKVYSKKVQPMYYEYVILHELGHTFGMGHLYSPKNSKICQVDKDSYISIMCYQNFSNVKNYTFTKADKLRLSNIYGK